MSDLLKQIADLIERGKIDSSSKYPPDLLGQKGAFEITKEALDSGISPEQILNEGMMIGMNRIGVKFRDGKIFIPDVLIAAKAMKASMELLKPHFLSGEVKHKGSIILGTVAGDLHDIGKNLVSMVVQGGGWNVIDLGVDVDADKFAAAVKEHDVSAVGLSALLTSTMQNMKSIVDSVKDYKKEIKIIIGGAPVTAKFASEIGADAYFADPQGALDYLNSSCV